jgi:hypothetical protein
VTVDVLLQAYQRHPGAGRHLGRGDVDRAQLVEAGEAHDQLAAEGHAAASLYFLAQELKARHKRVDMIIGPEGLATVEPLRAFLDQIGPHWFPIELDAHEATSREIAGENPFKAYFSHKFMSDFLTKQSQLKGRNPVQGSFLLSTVMDWMQPQRASIRAGAQGLDGALVASIGRYRAEFDRDPGWLDAHFPILDSAAVGRCRFAYDGLVRRLILEHKSHRLKKGDGTDFFHAVAVCALGGVATLDKHWKRRALTFRYAVYLLIVVGDTRMQPITFVTATRLSEAKHATVAALIPV